MDWDKTYSENAYAFGKEPNDFLRENVSQLKQGSVLCIAEGEGRNAVFLAKQGFQVTAMDASLTGLEKAQALASQEGVEIQTIHADLNEFNFGQNKWDNVISIFCHLPPKLRNVVHQNIKESLVSGGVFLIESYRLKQLELATGGPSQMERLMNQKQLEADFYGMKFMHTQECERHIAEGDLHKGNSAVVQLIAVK